MIARGKLPNDLARMLFEFSGADHDRLTSETQTLTDLFPEQEDIIFRFNRNAKFENMQKNYAQCSAASSQTSLADAVDMKALLSTYRRISDTHDFQYLRDDTPVDPGNNRCQLTVYRPRPRI